MEAIATYSYEANSESELSFNANDKIIIMPIDDIWARGKLNGKEGFVPVSYISVKPHEWFQGQATRESAEEILLKKNNKNGKFQHQDGAFLIRKSEASPGDFSLSVKFEITGATVDSKNVQHFKIFHKDDAYYIWKSKLFKSLNDLVDYHRTNTISKNDKIVLKDIAEEKSPNLLYKADFDFEAAGEDELSFSKGDVLNIIDNSDELNGWWKAEKDGKTGLVPSQYFTPI